jgi:hypothetical protein
MCRPVRQAEKARQHSGPFAADFVFGVHSLSAFVPPQTQLAILFLFFCFETNLESHGAATQYLRAKVVIGVQRIFGKKILCCRSLAASALRALFPGDRVFSSQDETA